MSMRWSDELVTRRYLQGWSQTRIAEAQGVARGTVRRVLLRHGVALRARPGPVTAYPGRRSWWAARLEPVRVDGTWRRVTVAELCTQFGVSRTVILRRLDRFDIPRHLIAADPPPEPGCTVAELEAWVARSTRPEQDCRRWIFTRAWAGREPVTHQGGKRTGVARLVWSLAHGPIPAHYDVFHTGSCHFEDCVRPEHLSAAAHATRVAGWVERGSFPRGAGHWAAKLTEADARHILTSLEPPGELAPHFGVSPATIRAIRARRRWKHL